MRSDDARKYITLLLSCLDLDVSVTGEPLFYFCYAFLDPDFSNWNVTLFNLDVDLRDASKDDTEQPAFVNDAWTSVGYRTNNSGA